MMLKQKLIIIWMLYLFMGCSNDDDSFSQTPIDSGNQTNVYPMPPSQWLGETNPYYTAGYVGDVMPYYDNGKFNLFFLHDAKTKPAGAGFHDIHSFVTQNFTNFNYNGRMIPYGEADEPDFGIGTGSVVKAGSVYYFYYTGHNGNTPFVQTNPRESVLCATSTDLKNWTKIEDFKLTAPVGYYDYDFRDPHVFYNEDAGEYWMLMSTQTDPERRAVVALFTTNDIASNNWTVQSPVYTTPPGEDYLMLECADMFKWGSYWYLIFSENWSDYVGTKYRMATSPYGPWTTPDNDRFDGTYFYAAKTETDGNNRYLFGWTARKAPENNTGNKEWAGNMVTHQLIQNPDGTLKVAQPNNIAGVFSVVANLEVQEISGNTSHNGTTVTLNASSGTATCSFGNLKKSNHIEFTLSTDSSGKTGLILAQEDNSGFKVVFESNENRLAAYITNDGNDVLVNHVPFNFQSGQTYQVSFTLSNDIAVLYINDEIAFSNRIYNISGKNWSIFSTDGNQASYTNLSLSTPY